MNAAGSAVRTERLVMNPSAGRISEILPRSFTVLRRMAVTVTAFPRQWKIPDSSVWMIYRIFTCQWDFLIFKIEGRGLGSALILEFLLYYIGEYWDILQKQEYLFINIKGDTAGKPMKVDSVYDMFGRMEKKTGIKITPHMLRRYYANTRWEADWPMEMISQALGHKHLDTTIRYLNVLDDKLKTASQEFYRRYSKLYGVEQFLESRR